MANPKIKARKRNPAGQGARSAGGSPLSCSSQYLESARSAASRWRELSAERKTIDPGDDWIHDVRVTARRLMEILALARPHFKKRKLRRQLKRLIRTLGPVRQADVTLSFLSKEAGRYFSELGEEFERQREKERRRLDLESLWVSAKRVEAIGSNLAGARSKNAPRFERRFVASRKRLLEKRLAPFATSSKRPASPANFHRFRIAAKKLRYFLECSAAGEEREILKAARVFQGSAGDWHDAAVAQRQLVKFQKTKPKSGKPGEAVRRAGKLVAARRDHLHEIALRKFDLLASSLGLAVLGQVRRRRSRGSRSEPSRARGPAR